MSQREIDDLAIMWNKTKDQKYKDLWYKKVKELSNGLNNTKRRDVQSHTGHKRDDGKYEVIHGSRKFI
jgi:hypothetical protein|tara:strand:+ start:375 stop:578 length:204 start_codon:yes stop_codon:yes gene_type:complete